MLATGHNLDDEAAVLFGNVLRWETEYLARQQPVLPAREGFPRKVKPLVRLGERETAAYCILRGIDYEVEECPMAVGNKHLGYKEALNAIEATSPGSKQQFYFGYLERAAEHFIADDDGEAVALSACERCGAPTPGDVCAFCRLAEQASQTQPVAAPIRKARSDGSTIHDGSTTMTDGRPLLAGEQVLLIDGKDRRYLVRLDDGGEFHTHAGILPHDDIIGGPEGRLLRANSGVLYRVLRPTLTDFVLKMKRGAQVIYPKDLGPLLLLADVFPGARVLESGVGSGALSMTLLRAGAEVVGYEVREDFAARAQANVRDFLGEDALDRYRVEIRDCYEGIDETDLDRVVLDLPEPWQVVPHAGQGAGARRDPRRLHPVDHPGQPAPPGPGRTPASSRPRPSRSSSAPGTWRASPSAPTTAWWPTPGS